MLGLTLSLLVVMTVSSAIGLWVLYYVLKCAIRDGINESALDARTTPRYFSRTKPADLPDMRAD